MRGMISAIIRTQCNADVSECASGLDALKVLPRHTFDLIVTDINMPDINGLELIQFLRSNSAYAAIPLIIVSTESSPKDRQKGLSLGADDYIVKPFDPHQLGETINNRLKT